MMVDTDKETTGRWILRGSLILAMFLSTLAALCFSSDGCGMGKIRGAMKKLYWLKCKYSDCFDSIVLPLPIHREMSPNLLLWPMDGKPRNFLCLACNHAYEYTLHEVQSGLGDTQGLGGAEKVDAIFRIEARCGESDCGAPVYILLPGPSLLAQVFAPAEWFEKGKHGVVRCSSDHLTAQIRAGSVCLQRDPSFWQ